MIGRDLAAVLIGCAMSEVYFFLAAINFSKNFRYTSVEVCLP